MLFQQGCVMKLTRNYKKIYHFTQSQPGGMKTNRKAQEHPIFAPLLIGDLLVDS